MAQAAHAANQFVGSYGLSDDVKEWIREGGYFGTTIVLGVNGQDIFDIQSKNAGKRPFGIVYDKEYPFITTPEIAKLIPGDKLSAPSVVKNDKCVVMFRLEMTCAYLFLKNDEFEVEKYIGSLNLYP